MAKLYFFYSSMNAGKSTHLLQANFNYQTNDHRTLLLKPSIDDRFGEDKITSRIGLDATSISVNKDQNLVDIVKKTLEKQPLKCILLDEVQFFSKEQILQLGVIVDQLNVTVMAYGLRNNFLGELFEGSKKLFEIADNLREVKSLCHCGKKATMVIRYDNEGKIAKSGQEIEIGAEDKYVSVCRKHFFEGDIGNNARKSLTNNKELEKEMFATIIARHLGLNFKEALFYTGDCYETSLENIKSELKWHKELLSETKNTFRRKNLNNSITKLEKTYFEMINLKK